MFLWHQIVDVEALEVVHHFKKTKFQVDSAMKVVAPKKTRRRTSRRRQKETEKEKEKELIIS